MMVLDAIVCGAFFVGGAITGALGVLALGFTSWCYRWPHWVWR